MLNQESKLLFGNDICCLIDFFKLSLLKRLFNFVWPDIFRRKIHIYFFSEQLFSKYQILIKPTLKVNVTLKMATRFKFYNK